MSLNIKNQQAHRLAQRLSKLTGESLTEAVTRALQERLSRIQESRKPDLAERLEMIGKDVAAHMKEPFRSAEHGDLLYDEKGLPR